MLQQHALGHGLVHGQRRGHRAAAGVRDAQQFQGALDRAVFAIAAMQGDEHPVEAFSGQLGQAAFARVEQVRVHAGAGQRLLHALAGHQRHFALGGTAAVQHTYFAELRAHASSPTWAGTLLIDPAPITITTSPLRTKSTTACGSSATSSTKTGSPLQSGRAHV
ncbi:hypothetical protein G6F62_014038 [Rhizopus arrhizus]|nr:hypothetical protein G6F62_014038 [Rhizopus arrhizus]